MTDNLGLYIHIPFCVSKCGYCDFLSFCGRESEWAGYKDALIGEIFRFGPSGPIDTIYIGGGTPTVWPEDFLSELLAALPSAIFGAEITCEANPGTLTPEKIAVLLNGGVNRISMGLQSTQPHLLKAIGRKNFGEMHFYDLRNAGFNNINIDIMFALPGQTLADWEETLKYVCDLEPEHISAYALTLEEGTPLWGTEICSEKIDRQMYHRCKTFLRERGYIQYELSNFCKPGFESRHNLRYWKRKPYMGFGLGAHSFANDVRWHNTMDMKKYLEDAPAEGHIPISQEEALSESIFLGLRMTEGVDVNDQGWARYAPWISKMKKDGLLCEKDGYIFLTDYGMDLSNLVMAGFLE